MATRAGRRRQGEFYRQCDVCFSPKTIKREFIFTMRRCGRHASVLMSAAIRCNETNELQSAASVIKVKKDVGSEAAFWIL